MGNYILQSDRHVKICSHVATFHGKVQIHVRYHTYVIVNTMLNDCSWSTCKSAYSCFMSDSVIWDWRVKLCSHILEKKYNYILNVYLCNTCKSAYICLMSIFVTCGPIIVRLPVQLLHHIRVLFHARVFFESAFIITRKYIVTQLQTLQPYLRPL